MYIVLHGIVGIKVADRIKIANQLTVRWGDYCGLSMWTQCNHQRSYK